MDRKNFLKLLPSVVLVFLLKSEKALAAHPPGKEQLDYTALTVIIDIINENTYLGDERFYSQVYARLGQENLDTSWPTAKKVIDRIFEYRNSLIEEANYLKIIP